MVDIRELRSAEPDAPRTIPSATASHLARLARQALIAEAELTPKPGLVDRRGPGAHNDLSLDLMRASATLIEPYLLEMARMSEGHTPNQHLREGLALIGRAAEQAMLNANGGANTHKGAIWILGLLVSAAAMRSCQPQSAARIAAVAAQLAGFTDRYLPHLTTHGQLMTERYGVRGARGEAIAGFPHVTQVGLPTLRARRRLDRSETDARLDTLLHLIATVDDTCLLHRGGRAALNLAKRGARQILRRGGMATGPGREEFAHFDRLLLASGLSPGGSADLLAATLFLDAVEQGATSVPPDTSTCQFSPRFESAGSR